MLNYPTMHHISKPHHWKKHCCEEELDYRFDSLESHKAREPKKDEVVGQVIRHPRHSFADESEDYLGSDLLRILLRILLIPHVRSSLRVRRDADLKGKIIGELVIKIEKSISPLLKSLFSICLTFSPTMLCYYNHLKKTHIVSKMCLSP